MYPDVILQEMMLNRAAVRAVTERYAWICADKRKPESGKTVLLAVERKNSAGKLEHNILRGQYFPQFTLVSADFNTDAEYNEEKDMYFEKAGWYEEVECWEDYSFLDIADWKVTHWCELPNPPYRS